MDLTTTVTHEPHDYGHPWTSRLRSPMDLTTTVTHGPHDYGHPWTSDYGHPWTSRLRSPMDVTTTVTHRPHDYGHPWTSPLRSPMGLGKHYLNVEVTSYYLHCRNKNRDWARVTVMVRWSYWWGDRIGRFHCTVNTTERSFIRKI